MNATNAIRAIPADDAAQVTITVNGAPHENGTAAVWEPGENTVVVVDQNGAQEKVYTVTVDKGEPGGGVWR